MKQLTKTEVLMSAESNIPKRYFPVNAEPPAPPSGAITPKVASKRTPWMKKPIENPHASPAGRCVNFREEFDKHVEVAYKKATVEQRDAAWRVIAQQMVTEPLSKLKELTDNYFTKL